jgi:DMSO/TMAO reductase YedYZ molybdopterin-dependent catalytic subunit
LIDPKAHRRGLVQVERRLMLRGALSVGALTMLSGCGDLQGDDAVDRALWAMLRFNDRVQSWLFDRQRLAAEFPASAITRPARFNAFYPEYQIRTVDPGTWRMEVGGLVADKRPLSLADLRGMAQSSQITRHICIEGWSQIGQWKGVKLSDVLTRVGADKRAKFVGFKCFDGYSASIDMASALQPQTILALDFDGAELDPPFGAPARLRIPTKLGFKSAKYLSAMFVTNTNPGGYWEDQGYDWFSGS